MATDLARGIIDGKTLRQWWDDAPFGAFQNKCNQLGMKLVFGENSDELKTYEVEVSYTYSGRGKTTLRIQAASEKRAEEMALERFDDSDIDCSDAEIDDVEVEEVNKIECTANASQSRSFN